VTRATRSTVEALCDALVSGDDARLHAALAPDVLMHGTVGGIDEGRVVRGSDAVVMYLAEVRDTWERLDVAIDAVHASGETAVLFMHETAVSTHTNVPIETDTATVLRVADGQIVEMQGYMDRAAALAAAGISG